MGMQTGFRSRPPPSYGPYYWVDDDALQDDVKPIDSLGRR